MHLSGSAVLVIAATLLPPVPFAHSTPRLTTDESHKIAQAPSLPRYPSSPLPEIGKGLFTVKVLGNPSQLQLNRLETLTIEISKVDAKPVVNAIVHVDARTRDVVRRMLTSPRMTRNLGHGRYRIEGLRFNMPGSWLLEFEILSGKMHDKALVELVID